MSTQRFSAITWAPYGDDGLSPGDGGSMKGVRCALNLSSQWTMTGGLEADINSGVASYKEFDKISDLLDRPGRIEMWYFNNVPASDSSSSGDTAQQGSDQSANADVIIEYVQVVEVRAGDLGQPIDQDGDLRPVEYEIFFADFRIDFAQPRGGRLTLGYLNAGPTPPDDAPQPEAGDPPEYTLSELILACLSKMGLADVDLPDNVDDNDAPREVKLFGNHAPTELKKLLEMAAIVFVPHIDGSVTLEYVAAGQPDIQADERLPDVTLPAVDRRGQYVVFTSYPNATLVTKDDDGGDGSSDDLENWSFVVQDKGKDDAAPWKKLSECSLLTANQMTYQQHVQSGFTKIDEQYRQRVAQQIFQFIQLDPQAWDPSISPLQRLVTEADGTTRDIVITATIATRDPNTGLWSNSTQDISIPAAQLIADQGIVNIGMPLIQVNASSASLQNGFKQAATFSVRYTVTSSSTQTVTKGGSSMQQDLPDYFSVGFKRNSTGALEQLDDDTVANIIDGNLPNALIIAREDLQLINVDGDDANRDQLTAKARALAENYLRTDQPATQIRVRGFYPLECSGQVSRVQWDQNAVISTADCSDWYTAQGLQLGHLDLRKTEANDAFPGQQKTSAAQMITGAPGAQQPAVPALPMQPWMSPGQLQFVSVGAPKTCGGMYAGTIFTSFPAFDPTQSTFTVSPSSTICVVVNLNEAGKTTHNIQAGTVLPYWPTAPQEDGTLTVVVLGSGGYTGTQNLVTDVQWDGTNLKEIKTPYEFTNGDLTKVDDPATSTIDTTGGCS